MHSLLLELITNLGIFTVTIISSFSYFFLTRVIKIEHDDFPVQWEEDGNPHGAPFWFPFKDGRMEVLGASPWSKGYRWLFKTPDWVKIHDKAHRMFLYFRFTQYAAWSILFIMFAVLLISALV